MCLAFDSIETALRFYKTVLKTQGKVFNRRTGRYVRQLLGVCFKVPIDGFGKYFKERPENVELQEAFDEALEMFFKAEDPTARYYFGRPKTVLHPLGVPCVVGVQLQFDGGKPVLTAYCRSIDLNQLPHDFAVLAEKMFVTFGTGEIIFFIGNLHLYEDGEDVPG